MHALLSHWEIGSGFLALIAFSVINDIHIIFFFFFFAHWHVLMHFILLDPQFPHESAHTLIFDKTPKIQSVHETRSTVKCFNLWAWYASGTCMAVHFFTILLLCKITFSYTFMESFIPYYNIQCSYAVTLYQNSDGVWVPHKQWCSLQILSLQVLPSMNMIVFNTIVFLSHSVQ